MNQQKTSNIIKKNAMTNKGQQGYYVPTPRVPIIPLYARMAPSTMGGVPVTWLTNR